MTELGRHTPLRGTDPTNPLAEDLLRLPSDILRQTKLALDEVCRDIRLLSLETTTLAIGELTIMEESLETI